jgi:hypothetical protein
MIDLYVDDVTLTEIQQKDKQILMFKNKNRDESLVIPISNDELLNIYTKARMRCETLDLIKPVYEGR